MSTARHVRRAIVLRDARATTTSRSAARTNQRVREAILLRDALTGYNDIAAPRAVTR